MWINSTRMTMIPWRCMTLVLGCALLGAAATALHAQAASPPAVGEPARDFTLSRLDGTSVQLSALNKAGPVVLVMLRGWVGYQ